jgi:predicted AlkP superfamily phosphohydrolase/phosphomutase
VSDHGFQDLNWVLYLNHALRRAGIASLKRTPTLRSISRLAPSSIRRLGANVLAKVSPQTLKASALSPLDWERSIAFAGRVFEQGIYVRKTGNARADAERRDAVIEVVMGIDAPDGRGKAVEKVLTREQIYSGPWMDASPDLFPIFRTKGVMIVPGFGDGRKTWDPIDVPHGTHHPDGVIIARGPDIAPGSDCSADIADVAPTIMRLLGGPIPKGLDGKAIPTLGSGDIVEREIAIEREPGGDDVYSESEQEELVERLRGLGYID